MRVVQKSNLEFRCQQFGSRRVTLIGDDCGKIRVIVGLCRIYLLHGLVSYRF